MPRKKYSSFKVGIFVLVSVLIVTSTVFWAKSFFLETNMRTLHGKFITVSGLNKGDFVTVTGVKKGVVKNFDVEGDSVYVTFIIEETIKIKNDYRLEIISTELMGGKTLNIFPGKYGSEIDYSFPLTGKVAFDISSIATKVVDMTDDVKTLIGNFNKASLGLDTLLVSLNDIMSDKGFKKNIKNTASNFEATSRSLNALISENRVTLKTLAEKTGLTIDKVGVTVDNVNSFVDDSKPGVKESLNSIKDLTVKVSDLVINLNKLVIDIQDPTKGMGKFINDPAFYNNLNNTLLEIEKMTKKIREEGIKLNLF